MAAPLLATKLYLPPARPNGVPRPRLIERLDKGVACRLTLISAPAGFGKTTLISQWLAGCDLRVAWLSLDADDSEPTRFLIYLVAALQTVTPNLGAESLQMLQSSQRPSAESMLTALLNEISASREELVLVLDDYHVLDSQAVDRAVAFLVEHLPPQMRLIIATREDPHLPLARLRACSQLTELRAADLRFTPAEAAAFLNEAMGLGLSAEDIAALEARTEGWIAGLQLAALSMQAHPDAAGFIKSFNGSHRFVMDYLVEEVLGQQPERVQSFLLRTSILERMCGALCDAVLCDPSVSGQETLEYLERANLFVVPLDNERGWYRYHHLFADLLRQRLQQGCDVAPLHLRASQWYEEQGLELEAFRHAAAANGIDRAERLISGRGMPSHSLAVRTSILGWLDSLPKSLLDARPWLWVRSATTELMTGQTSGVEEKLRAAEHAMQGAYIDENILDLNGQIAAVRATLADIRYEPEAAIVQARRALECLHPENLPYRSRAAWSLGFAYQLQGNHAAAREAYAEAIQWATGNTYYTVLATTCLGQIQEAENLLHEAAETYQRSLQLLSDQGPPDASEEYIGLARVSYQWNDLDAAERYGQQSLEFARRYDRTVDRFVGCEVFLAHLKLARGDVDGAAALLAQAQESAYSRNYTRRLPEIAATQVLVVLRQGNVAAAAHLAQQYPLTLSWARVLLAQGDPTAALAILGPFRQKMEAKGWLNEQLKAKVLEAVAYHAQGDGNEALRVLGDALAMAEPGGFIRLFVDEGAPMAELLSEAADRGVMLDYVGMLLAAFEAEQPRHEPETAASRDEQLAEALTERELDVLHLIAQGLSNHEICERLFLALDTVKGHNRRIFGKLQVQSRTAAIVRARELGLI